MPTLSHIGSGFGLTALVGCLLSGPAALGGEILYATGSGINTSAGLWVINASTGQSTLLYAYPGVIMTQGGLAYDRASDSLYASGFVVDDQGGPYLFKLDRFTGGLQTIGRIQGPGAPGADGVAIHPVSGQLYGIGYAGFGQSSGLFTIDKQTGAAVLVGANGPSCCTDPFGFNMGGLGFQSNGSLYANGSILSGGVGSALFQINIEGGAAQQIGAHGVSVGRSLFYSGLAFRADGKLFSLGSKDAGTPGLYLVDPTTGHATLVGEASSGLGTDGGLTFAPGPRPLVKFGRTDQPRLRVSWSSDVAFSGVVLQKNKSLAADGWQNVPDAPANADGQFYLDVDLGEPQAFYRLVEP